MPDWTPLASNNGVRGYCFSVSSLRRRVSFCPPKKKPKTLRSKGEMARANGNFLQTSNFDSISFSTSVANYVTVKIYSAKNKPFCNCPPLTSLLRRGGLPLSSRAVLYKIGFSGFAVKSLCGRKKHFEPRRVILVRRHDGRYIVESCLKESKEKAMESKISRRGFLRAGTEAEP